MAEVSVIIPVYNTEPWLEECLKSVCSQTLQNIEIICINDGSTDNSLRVLQRYAEHDDRIIIINQENRGVSHARNTGINRAGGKYIYFLDSDDYIEYDALKFLVCEMQAKNLEILFFNTNILAEKNADDKRVQKNINYYRRIHEYPSECRGEELYRLFWENKEYVVSVCTFLTDRNFLIRHSLEFPEGIIHEDELFIFECLLSASRAGFSDRALYNRRVRPGSIMDMKHPEKVIFSVFSCFVSLKQMLQFCSTEAEFRKENEEAVFSNLKRIATVCYNRYGTLNDTSRKRLFAILGKDLFLFRLLILNLYNGNEALKRLTAENKLNSKLLKKLETGAKKNSKLDGELKRIKSGWSFRLGRTITYLPSKVKSWLKKTSKKEDKHKKQDPVKDKAELTEKTAKQNEPLVRELLKTEISKSKRQILSDRYFLLTGETVDLNNNSDNAKNVLLVEFNNWHGECIPGFYKYLSELNFDVDVLVSESVYKEKALDAVNCKNVYHCNIELMALLLQYVLMERYKFVIFNSNAFLWAEKKKGKWFTVLQEFPFLNNYLDKIYVLEHQMEYLNKTLLEMGHVFVLTDKLPLDKRLVPVNCHWFGNREIRPKNKMTQFISVGAMIPMRRNFEMLLEAVTYLVNRGITNFHITIIGVGKLDDIDAKILPFFSILGRVSYPVMYVEMQNSDFFLTLLDPDNPAHDRYITTGTSGSFQLVYGFSKPCLIAEKFADIYGFSPENAIVYKENQELGPAMLQAIDMTEADYDGIRNNLGTVSNDIYNKSLENLKRTLADSNPSGKD